MRPVVGTQGGTIHFRYGRHQGGVHALPGSRRDLQVTGGCEVPASRFRSRLQAPIQSRNSCGPRQIQIGIVDFDRWHVAGLGAPGGLEGEEEHGDHHQRGKAIHGSLQLRVKGLGRRAHAAKPWSVGRCALETERRCCGTPWTGDDLSLT